MSHRQIGGISTKVETAEDKLPEGPEAYQAISGGPLLETVPQGFFEWVFYYITFHWVAAYFSSPHSHATRPAYVEKLLAHAQTLLAGRINAVRAGNIYAVNSGKAIVLSLSNTRLSLSSTSFFADKSTLRKVQNLLTDQTEGEISLLLPAQVTVKPEISKGFCHLTFSYQHTTYQIHYPLLQDETPGQLAMRITSDRTLERDLLLTRSFFARSFHE